MYEQLLNLKEMLHTRSAERRKPDKQTRRLLLYLFTSTRGGLTRLRIIALLIERQCNTHQISVDLGMDYKTVQHHMKVLEKNNLVSKTGPKYGTMYRLSNLLELNISTLDEAMSRLDRKMNHKKVYL